MEGTPSYMHYAEVLEVFEHIEGVRRVHNLRIWALSINKIALSVHLAIGEYKFFNVISMYVHTSRLCSAMLHIMLAVLCYVLLFYVKIFTNLKEGISSKVCLYKRWKYYLFIQLGIMLIQALINFGLY